MCDGVSHCVDGSDEEEICKVYFFYVHCIPFVHLFTLVDFVAVDVCCCCLGSTVADCQVNNGGCEGVCHQLTSTRFCSCPPGYQLDLSDLSSCNGEQ